MIFYMRPHIEAEPNTLFRDEIVSVSDDGVSTVIFVGTTDECVDYLEDNNIRLDDEPEGD